jgi:uncharacterized protein
MKGEDVFAALTRLYADIDEQVRRLSRVHAGRLQCGRGCCSCCVDGITVHEIEARHIQHHYREVLEKESPHQAGACAFLNDAGACRIYAHRPYVCRTQGLPLRWIEERSDGSAVEMRDICPLNENGEPIESLPEEDCWSIGPVEGRLARLQAAASGGKMTRIALRDLFVKGDLPR